MSRLPMRGLALALAATAMLALAPATATATALPANVRPSLADAPNDIEVISTNGCRVKALRVEPRTDCIYGDPNGTKQVVLVGDSHAAHLFPPLNMLAKARHWKLIVHTKISCRFVDLRHMSRELEREYYECEQWRNKVIERLRAKPPAMTIFVVARGLEPLPNRPGDNDPAVQGHALARLMVQIPGGHVVIVDTPTSYHDVPACLQANQSQIEQCATDRDLAFTWRHMILEQTAVADDPGATLVNISKQICPIADDCQAVRNGMIVWRDFHHLTRTFAKSLQSALAARIPNL
jgi:hypothetical protein